MSSLRSLTQSVLALAAEVGRAGLTVDSAVPAARRLSSQLAQRARASDAAHEWMRAAQAADAAARELTRAAAGLTQARARAATYAAFLAQDAGQSAGVPASSLLPDGPLPTGVVAASTTDNRIDLAHDVPDVRKVPDFGGYLDVVMHGDADGTQAAVAGERIDFTFEEVVSMVEASPAWHKRPIRLLSCSTGQGSYAQRLADRLGVPVYAPSDVLDVAGGVKTVWRDGVWRRFEPGR